MRIHTQALKNTFSSLNQQTVKIFCKTGQTLTKLALFTAEKVVSLFFAFLITLSALLAMRSMLFLATEASSKEDLLTGIFFTLLGSRACKSYFNLAIQYYGPR